MQAHGQKGETMSRQNTVNSIREINLSYLMLAQCMLREDRAVGMSRLGLSAQVGDLLASLTRAQVVKLAASDQLLCFFRFDDATMLSALTQPARRATDVVPPHAAVLLANRPAELFVQKVGTHLDRESLIDAAHDGPVASGLIELKR
jgi:flagellar transcriptional activator FlhD